MNDLLWPHKPKNSLYFSLSKEGGPMVLALDDSNRIAKHSFKVFNNFNI